MRTHQFHDIGFPLGAASFALLRLHSHFLRERLCHAVMIFDSHRTLIPRLVELVREGGFDPLGVLSHREPPTYVLDAYRAFDAREPGWIKVKLEP